VAHQLPKGDTSLSSARGAAKVLSFLGGGGRGGRARDHKRISGEVFDLLNSKLITLYEFETAVN
jgi:hypothetical protein